MLPGHICDLTDLIILEHGYSIVEKWSLERQVGQLKWRYATINKYQTSKHVGSCNALVYRRCGSFIHRPVRKDLMWKALKSCWWWEMCHLLPDQKLPAVYKWSLLNCQCSFIHLKFSSYLGIYFWNVTINLKHSILEPRNANIGCACTDELDYGKSFSNVLISCQNGNFLEMVILPRWLFDLLHVTSPLP